MKWGTIGQKAKQSLLCLLIALSTILSNSIGVEASTAVTIKKLEATGYTWTGTALDPETGIGIYGTNASIDKIYLSDGNVGFCIEPWTLVSTDAKSGNASYARNEQQKQTISTIIYHGYWDTEQTDLDYAVTQLMIWEYLGFTPDSTNITNYETKKAEIQALVDDHATKVSFNGESGSVDLGDSITVTDTNGVLSDFTWKASGCSISISGNKLTITPNEDASDTVTVTGTKFDTSYVKASYVYTLDDSQTIYAGYLADAITVTYTLTVNKYGSLELTKQDNENIAIEGAQFLVSYHSDMSDPIGTYTTNSDGKILIEDLSIGTVYYQEISVPENLVLDTTIYEATIVANEMTEKVITNAIQKAEATLRKEDSETGSTAQGDATFAGATYELRALEAIVNPNTKEVLFEQDALVATVVMDENGESETITGLYNGMYYWIETVAPEGYVLNDDIIEVDLTYSDSSVSTITSSQTAYDDVIKGKIKLFKTSTDGSLGLLNGLAGAEFTVKLLSEVNEVGWDDATTYAVLVTNETGLATSEDLPYGTYLVKETTTPEDVYRVDDFTVTIDENEETVFYALNDAPYEAYVTIIKQDEDGNVIAYSHADFQIYDEAGNLVTMKIGKETIDTFTTDENGQVTTPLKLSAGTYTLKEVGTPTGFLGLNQEVTFAVNAENETNTDEAGDAYIVLIVENEKPTGTIMITKLYEGQDVTGGSKFMLQAACDILDPATGDILYEAGDQVIVEGADEMGYYTIVDGHCIIEGLPLSLGEASYLLSEVRTVDGYVCKEETWTFTFTQEDESTLVYEQAITIENKLTNIEIMKLNGEDLISGALLQILDEEGTIIEEWVSDGTTHAIQGLTVGQTYTLHEVNAPEGYLLSEDVDFIVENTEETQFITIFDALDLKALNLVKTDEVGNVIVGLDFTFGLYEDKEATHLLEIVLGDKETGIASFTDLAYGTYYIQEIESPDGYSLSDKILEVIVNQEGIQVDGVPLEETDGSYTIMFENETIPSIDAIATGDDTSVLKLVCLLFVSFAIGMIGLEVWKRKQP